MDKRGFAIRLNQALTDYGVSPPSEGRQAETAKLFNVKQQTVSQWLKGAVYPRQEKINEIAATLDVTREWLLMGDNAPHLIREPRAQYGLNITPAEQNWLLKNYSKLNNKNRKALKTIIEQLVEISATQGE